MLVREVVRECQVRTELLQARLALRAGAVGIDQASHRGEIARLKLGNRRSDLGHAANNLMARDNRVHRRHHSAPLVASLVKIRVADAAEKDFDLDVVFGGLAPINLGGRKWRCRAGCGIGFCLVSSWMHV